jgi:hypothetical protein
MEVDVLFMHFPKGSLPVRGFRCPKCKSELIPIEEGKRVQQLAEKLGLFGAPNALNRKIAQSGNNLVVYVPKEYERQLGLAKGDPIKIWLKDDEICIQVI